MVTQKGKSIDVNTETRLLGFFFTDNHWRVNKVLVRALGLKETLWLTDLLSRYNILKKSEKLTEEGWFYNTQVRVQKEMGPGFSRGVQTEIIQNLENRGVIQVKREGIPPKNYFKIDLMKLISIHEEQIQKEQETEEEESSDDEECQNGDIYMSETATLVRRERRHPLVEKGDTNIINKNITNKVPSFLERKKEGNTESRNVRLSETARPPDSHEGKTKDRSSDEERSVGVPEKVSPEALEIISHWNSVVSPLFPRHNNFETEDMKKVIKFLDKKTVLKYGVQEIKGSIDRAVTMYRHKTYFSDHPPYKMSLLDFLTANKDPFRKKKTGTPWFRRLLGEESHLKFLSLKDKFPELTDAFKKYYWDHTTLEYTVLTPKQETQFRLASEKLHNYIENGDRLKTYVKDATPITYVENVYEALLNKMPDDKDSSDIEVGNLCSDYTWNNLFPRYLTKKFAG